MDLQEKVKIIKKKYNSNRQPGTVDKIFEYNQKSYYNKSGIPPEFIKYDIPQIHKRKSIN